MNPTGGMKCGYLASVAEMCVCVASVRGSLRRYQLDPKQGRCSPRRKLASCTNIYIWRKTPTRARTREWGAISPRITGQHTGLSRRGARVDVYRAGAQNTRLSLSLVRTTCTPWCLVSLAPSFLTTATAAAQRSTRRSLLLSFGPATAGWRRAAPRRSASARAAGGRRT